MMLGESFKQAAAAGRWTQALPSYIARTINKHGVVLLLGKLGCAFHSSLHIWGCFYPHLYPFTQAKSSQIKHI